MESDRPLVLIFANGTIDDLDTAAGLLAVAEVVIAADGGARHALALGRRPDALIGDLDSLPDEVASAPDMWAAEVIRHPTAKDETDLELALLLARRRFPRAELVVLGGLGGRLDHTLANLLLLAHTELVGRPVRFVEGRESIRLIVDHATLIGRAGDIVSLLPIGGPARVAETTGLRWPLRGETLAFGAARGVSNEMTAARATISLDEGMVWCIHTAAGSAT